jgi:hypothetical protein
MNFEVKQLNEDRSVPRRRVSIRNQTLLTNTRMHNGEIFAKSKFVNVKGDCRLNQICERKSYFYSTSPSSLVSQ